MITNYASLLVEAANAAKRRDLASVMPSLVQRAEAALFREFELYRLTVTAAGTTTGGIIPLPLDVGAIESVAISADGRSRVLDYAPGDDGMPTAGGGTPAWYVVVPGAAQLLPKPGAEYAYTLRYAPKLTPLSEAAPTNWLLLNAPDVYLYATCVQIGIDVHDDALIVRHTQFLNNAIQSLRSQDARARLSRMGGLRFRPRSAV